MQPSRLKSLLRYLRACFLYRTGLLWLAYNRFARRRILVLTFHRVLDDAEFYRSSSQPAVLVRKSTFREFLAWLSKRAEIVDLTRGLPRWDTPSWKPRVALTFDDGWLDNHRHAIPAAVDESIPVTLFICPGLLNRVFPFWPERVAYLLRKMPPLSSMADRLRPLRTCSDSDPGYVDNVIETLKQMAPEDRTEWVRQLEEFVEVDFPSAAEPTNRTMSWPDVRELRKLGTEIGSHTMTHPILTYLPEELLTAELLQSRRQIEAGLDAPCTVLAYPNGNHNPEIRAIAAHTGYKAAFTTEPGLWSDETDLFRIPRVNVFEKKLIGLNGRFSPAMASYYLFWRAVWPTICSSSSNAR